MRRRDVAAAGTPRHGHEKRQYNDERPHISSTLPDHVRFQLATGDIAPGWFAPDRDLAAAIVRGWDCFRGDVPGEIERDATSHGGWVLAASFAAATLTGTELDHWITTRSCSRAVASAFSISSCASLSAKMKPR